MIHRMVLLIMTIFLSGGAMAQTVFAVVVGDTNDGRLGPGVKENIARIEGLLSQVHSQGNINVSIAPEVVGDTFGCAAIKHAVDAVQWSDLDTLIVWYSGHGSRNISDTKIFPVLNCIRHPEDSVRPDRGLDIESGSLDGLETEQIIADVLSPGPARKPPRLLLVIVDACNNSVSASSAIPAGAAPVGGRPEAFRKLLLRYSGAIVMSGSKQNEYSYYFGDDSGGYFTKQMVQALSDVGAEKGNSITWDDVLNAGTKTIIVPNSSQGSQQPQHHEINLQLLQ